jgi:hypothetical protein
MWYSTSAVQCSTLLLELQCITDAGQGISEMFERMGVEKEIFTSLLEKVSLNPSESPW